MLAGLVPYPLRFDKGLQRGMRRFGWANLLFSIYAWAIARQSSAWEIPALAIWFLLLSLFSSSSTLSQNCLSAYYSYLDAYAKRAGLIHLHSYRGVSYQRKCKCETTRRRGAIKHANAGQRRSFSERLAWRAASKWNHNQHLELNAISRPVTAEGTFSRVIVFKLTTERQPPVWNNVETAQMKRPIKD